MDQIGALRANGVRTVLLCYDLIPYLFPQLYGPEETARFTEYVRGMLRAADSVLCISHCTMRDLTEFARAQGTPPARAGLLRLGSDYTLAQPVPVPSVAPRFILYVATLDRRKNHEVLYKAYVSLHEKHRTDPPQCVLVGMPSRTAAEIVSDITLDPRVKGNFLILTGASDGEVRWLYDNCLFTVFPSLYEGWGLPIVESLSHGKLVLAADTSSIREVGGDLVEYLDPWDVSAWSEQMMFYSGNRVALLEREARIRDGFAAPTWDDSAASLVEHIEQRVPGGMRVIS